MLISDQQHPEMRVCEAFLRRAAGLESPFMLKGSYVTRQYFANPADRVPNDLDWLYLDHLPDPAQARQVFNDWVTQVTEQQLDDGVRFRSFRENAFWRLMDYAMDDDFPTANTDLGYWLDDAEAMQEVSLDISFNLPLSVPGVPLHYTPLRGTPFVLPHTAPLALQVSWKMHQTLVRPRFKDLFDLLHLLQHPAFTDDTRRQALRALVQECQADGTHLGRAQWLIQGQLAALFPPPGAATSWAYWRHGTGHSFQVWDVGRAASITEASVLPDTLAEFEAQLRSAFQVAGFEQALEELPAAPNPLRASLAVHTDLRRHQIVEKIDQAATVHWHLLDWLLQLFKRK